MGNELRRRSMLISGDAAPQNMVTDFVPFTATLASYENRHFSLSEVPVRGRTYRIVLDATVSADSRATIYIGSLDGGAEFPYDQDGNVEVIKTITANPSSATIYVYCRPRSGSASQTITVRNLELYDITGG